MLIYEKKFRFKQKLEFYNEIKIYNLLDNYDCFPKLIDYDENSLAIRFEHCGEMLGSHVEEIKKNKNLLMQQFLEITRILEFLDVTYVDFHLNNLLWKDNRLYLIDFGPCCLGIPERPKKNPTLDAKQMVREYRFQLSQYHLYFQTKKIDLYHQFVSAIDQY
jgi:predicted Ser/Thr protein kinase